MKKLDGSIIDPFKGKIVNIHQSLLPKYSCKGIYESQVCKGVLKKREYPPGVNVHLVNSEYDEEEILSQPTIPIGANKTTAYLAAKAHRLEHHLVIRTIKEIIEKNRSTRYEKKTK